MAKGFFTQSVCLLTNGKTTLDDMKSALRQKNFEIVKEMPARENWEFSGPSVVVAYLPEVNGYVTVDVVNEPWPDSMGDPNSNMVLFSAWSMGHFGPLTYPGSLERAKQHSWAWQSAETISEGHRGFIRLRMSYVFGANKDKKVMPEDYDAVEEMKFLSRMVLPLLKAPGVICYFNPNGEVLRDEESFNDVWNACEQQHFLPLPLWMNIRFFNLNEKLGFMDTVGNGQLDLRDVEAVFPSNKYDPGDVDYYLRNVTQYLMGLDRDLKTGETIDGPGENNLTWTMEVLDLGVVDPPRRVLRLYPKAIAAEVKKIIPNKGK